MLESIEKLRDYISTNQRMRGWKDNLSDIADEIEREISERYMLLPVDMDGVPIHVGDELQDANGVKVIAECVGSDGFCANGAHRNGWCNYRHVKPRTMRDILFDFMRDCETSQLGNSELVEKYEEELRELLGGDAS